MRSPIAIPSLFSRMLCLFLLTAAAIAGDLKWPDKDKMKAEDQKTLSDRYSQASKKALGSDADIEQIRKLIVAHMKQPEATVNEIRWLSPILVMAETSWHRAPKAGAKYFYVAEKKKDTWEIKTYY